MAAVRMPQGSRSTSNTAIAEADESDTAERLCVFTGDEQVNVELDKLAAVESDWQPGDWLFRGTVDGVAVTMGVERTVNRWRLSQGGSVRDYQVMDPHVAALMHYMPVKESKDMSRYLLSPMPGLLMKVLVSEGEKVTAGQDLAIIEAMKMENTLSASVDGTVSRIVASIGDSLAVDEVIIEFEQKTS